MKDRINERIKEYKAKFKEWWEPLAPREKQAVTIGGAVLGLFILYAGIWSPFLNHLDTMRSRITSEQKTLLWMQAADKELQKATGQTQERRKVSSPVVLLSDLQKLVEQMGLAQNLTDMKQSSNDSIALRFQKVEFDKLVKMLIALVKAESVNISQMSVKAVNGAPGAVDADLEIKLG